MMARWRWSPRATLRGSTGLAGGSSRGPVRRASSRWSAARSPERIATRTSTSRGARPNDERLAASGPPLLAPRRLREVLLATPLALPRRLLRWQDVPVEEEERGEVRGDGQRDEPEHDLRGDPHEQQDVEEVVRPERPGLEGVLGGRERPAPAPVVPDDVRGEREQHGVDGRPVKARFAVERREKTVNEVTGVEDHGLAILRFPRRTSRVTLLGG